MDAQAIWLLVGKYLLPGGVGTIFGAFVTHFIESYRNRVKEIEYTVTHDRLGIAADDQVHGTVEVQWQKQPLQNLFSSTVTVKNETSQDYKDFTLAVWAEDATFMLSERLELMRSTFIPVPRKEYLERFAVPEGKVATEAQTFLFRHRREYTVPVLNRGDNAIFRYLTTVPSGGTPALVVDALQPGLRAVFKKQELRLLGAPIRSALIWGMVACVAILLVLQFFFARAAWSLTVAMLSGFLVIPIGAYLYITLRAIKRIVLH